MTTSTNEAGGNSGAFLGMDDEEFLKDGRLNPSGSDEQQDPVQNQDPNAITDPAAGEANAEDNADKTAGTGGTAAAAASDDGAAAQPDSGVSGSDETKPADKQGTAAAEGSESGADADKTSDKDPEKPAETGDKGAAGDQPKDPKDAGQGKSEGDAAPEPIDFEAVYKQIMMPFKANGRMVEPKTPEEAIRLMQMGAGFGRKLQDMQPHLKTLRMLEKNDLLDEGKLSFLIDINNKNPDAIKKLIKDSGIDPLDLNMGDNVSYSPQNHAVSDEEVAFHGALADLQGQPNGPETIQVINQTWDEQSKALLWSSPEILGVIREQRELGIYDKIIAEIEHQKTFGKIPLTTPFLQAYKTAGDALVASGSLTDPATTGAPAPAKVTETKPAVQPQVIATRVEPVKPVISNNDAAAAASPTPTVPRKAAALINPLDMADDEFLKTFKGRL